MVEVKMGILELGFSGAFQSGFLVEIGRAHV